MNRYVLAGVALIVFGSMIIMTNLNHNMMMPME